MNAIKGVFDGQSIKLLEAPPSMRPASVIVIFLSDDESLVDALKEKTAAYQIRVAQADLESGSTDDVALEKIARKVGLVLGEDGQPIAVQIPIADWWALMDRLEDVEDAALMRERFRERRERAVTAWEDFEAELKADGLL